MSGKCSGQWGKRDSHVLLHQRWEFVYCYPQRMQSCQRVMSRRERKIEQHAKKQSSSSWDCRIRKVQPTYTWATRAVQRNAIVSTRSSLRVDEPHQMETRRSSFFASGSLSSYGSIKGSSSFFHDHAKVSNAVVPWVSSVFGSCWVQYMVRVFINASAASR